MKYLEISKDVLISDLAYSTIVYYATHEIKEVATINTKNNSITEKKLRQIVKLTELESGIEINIYVSLCYGFHLEDVTKAIQANVYEVLKSSIGFAPTKIHIHVNGIVMCG